MNEHAFSNLETRWDVAKVKKGDLEKIIRPVIADAPDVRDKPYEPALIRVSNRYPADLPDRLRDWDHGREILDQGNEGACTGFALAAAINELNRGRDLDEQVSPYMLYDMARRYDEWDGEDYEGSSLRGAIRGWKNAGACDKDLFKKRGRLTLAAAKDARRTRLGAYYRLRPELNDFQVALNEVGILFVSATTHDGWDLWGKGKIPFKGATSDGGHAFAIVGYADDGFIVQNSWGPDWGRDGMAIWSYEDWSANLMDAWVVRLAARTPKAFGLVPKGHEIPTAEGSGAKRSSTKRIDIAGHFAHVDDGKLVENDRYWSTEADIGETAAHLSQSDEYEHLLFYAHGGLNSPKASASRIAAMKAGWKRNKIYPFHFMYDTGILEELGDIVARKLPFLRSRVGGFTDFTDRRIEGLTRKPGSALWTEMKRDARVAFGARGGGTKSLNAFLAALDAPGVDQKKLHLVGHSTGGILLAHLLERLVQLGQPRVFESVSLYAPANTLEQFEEIYRPLLRAGGPIRIKQLDLYVLSEELELDDNVGGAYRKSLLYLVSNAFESEQREQILGMKTFHDDLADAAKLDVLVATKNGAKSASESHGGFDNDPATLNNTLKRILGRASRSPFEAKELDY